LRSQHNAGHERGLPSKEDPETDPQQVPEQKEGESDCGDQGSDPRITPEEESIAKVDEGHAPDGYQQEGQIEEAHSGSANGSALRSWRRRVMTRSALIRHIGRPIPGTVVPPAYSSP